MENDPINFAILGLVALFAGMVDAVVGGGGMVQVPALFAVYPVSAPAALFGVNKFSAAVGTSGAAVRYARAVSVPWQVIIPAMLFAFLAAIAGAYAILWMSAEPLRKALPFILSALLIYMVFNRIGLDHQSIHSRSKEMGIAGMGAAAIGFYDGFFGTGTGAFYRLLFVKGLGYSFITSAAPSKIINVASNLGAIIVFGVAGQIQWSLAVWMALLNFAGGQAGSRLALRYGCGFIRYAYILVVICLIVKVTYDAYLR